MGLVFKSFSVLLAVCASVVAAFSASNDVDRQDDMGETIVFKRDDVLTARDLELAEMHGVDILQSR